MIVALGFGVCASAGALARWWWSTRRHRRWHDHLPLLAGSDAVAPTTTLAGTALLGAYTTFSTFVRETHGLVTTREHARAAAYVAVSLVGGVAAALAGLALTS